ncbi:MAG: bifunctional proline dehydrogenase/L-glutamate gamma-semialdehyde dehydrogenase PutA [Pseudomonadota bacterium]
MGTQPPAIDELSLRRQRIDAWHLMDETHATAHLLRELGPYATLLATASATAANWVAEIRAAPHGAGLLQTFLQEYHLASDEGVALMCLAEALLRIPDTATANQLIQDKFAVAHWETHLGHSHSWFVNASTWGLLLTGRILQPRTAPQTWTGYLTQVVARGGEPLIRAALKQAMRILGRQFVMATHIHEALQQTTHADRAASRYSFDMLGEAALTSLDAERYFYAYTSAIEAVGMHAQADMHWLARPSISVKLSALHPRFEFAQYARVMHELTPRLLALARTAQRAGIGLTIDAEETERLDITLEVFTRVFADPALQRWEGLGLAVQAYQKRAWTVIDYLAALAHTHTKRIAVRLVKGAYWDSEIKRAQERGLAEYPVFTRKSATDVSYLACARRLLADPQAFYAQFATHNAHTVAAIMIFAQGRSDFEFQRLHGMGEALYRALSAHHTPVACRVYAPIGRHTELLPYLVRRLLENGANSSFVHRLQDPHLDIADIVADPLLQLPHSATTALPLPPALFGTTRKNSTGYNLFDTTSTRTLCDGIAQAATQPWQAASIVGGQTWPGTPRKVTAPADRRRVLGEVVDADANAVAQALSFAARAFTGWAATDARQRALLLRNCADLFEKNAAELLALIVHEGGRCIPDAIAELRETVDYCRYYATWIEDQFAAPITLPGPTGEDNILFWRGRGVFVCISPWNFPLAIFVGQISAALAAGNCVIAKPAGATPLAATRAVEIMHRAGVPVDVLHLLIGDGARIGARLLSDTRVAGVAFTGATATARAIQVQLAARSGAIIPLIAETGGINAMIVDSSAHPEQAVNDILTSAFNSAGQRCSALRIVYIQRDIAARVLGLLGGALAERQLGDPARLATDIGPLIHAQAQRQLQEYCASLRGRAELLYELALPPECQGGDYFAPRIYLLERAELLNREIFGPILHIAIFNAADLDHIVATINRTGYGLTFGIHSRIQARIDDLATRVHAGNIYVNRSTIGAVVGVQPFGGEGLSGTGPKAGGPHYLYRFATEVVVSQNIAATGGNTALLSAE